MDKKRTNFFENGGLNPRQFKASYKEPPYYFELKFQEVLKDLFSTNIREIKGYVYLISDDKDLY